MRLTRLPGAQFGGARLVRVDSVLLFALVVMSVLSLFVLYSAGGKSFTVLWRQSARIAVGFAVLLALARVQPESLARWSPYLYAVGLSLLALVLGVGIIGKGAQRWLDIGIVRFQPAEIMKLAVPMMVAWVMSRTSLPPRIGDLLLAAVIIFVPVLFIVLEPDLGTAIMISISGLLVIFLGGMRWSQIVVLAGLLLAAAPVLWTFVLHDYQQRRILTLFDPWADPLGAGYHTIQAVIAIGAGGLTGKGWLNGSQSQLDFIPERSTDFIFAVLAEEFGLIGVIFLITVCLLIIGRCLWVAWRTPDAFCRLLTGGLTLTFFFYLFVNIAMVSGILPVVGVPLPLVSYGGTSMVTLMAGFGIIMGVYARYAGAPAPGARI